MAESQSKRYQRKKLKRFQQRPILSFDELIAATDIERKAYGQRRSTNARAAKKEKAAKDPAYALQLKVDKKKYHDTEYVKIKARRATDEEFAKDRREKTNQNLQVWRKANPKASNQEYERIKKRRATDPEFEKKFKDRKNELNRKSKAKMRAQKAAAAKDMAGMR